MYRHPIVALTANVQDGIWDNCLYVFSLVCVFMVDLFFAFRKCGMDDFISKPINFKQLTSMLDKYLSSNRHVD